MLLSDVFKIESCLNENGNSTFLWEVAAAEEKCNAKLASQHV